MRTSRPTIRIKARHLKQHVFIMGDSGVGKSKLERQFILQAEKNGDTCVIFDPEREFLPEFYNPERGDIILDPSDQRCPYWNIFDEVTDEAEAITVAKCMFKEPPLDNSSSGRFFYGHCMGVAAYLLAYGKKSVGGTEKADTSDFGHWLAHPDEEIDPRIAGSEHEVTLSRNSPPQRGGILGTLNEVGKALRIMPGPSEMEGRQRFCIRDWVKERKGWIFMTSTPETEEALLQLHSMWADLILLGLRSVRHVVRNPLKRQAEQAKRVWVILAELGNLSTLVQIPNAITRMRKRGHTLVMDLQNREQLERLYGRHAKTIFSQCRTKFIFATSEEESARALSGLIGEREVVRVKESVSFSGGFWGGRQRSYSEERTREPLVMPSEIHELQDMECYMIQRGDVVKLMLPNIEIDHVAPALLPRKIPALERRPIQPEPADLHGSAPRPVGGQNKWAPKPGVVGLQPTTQKQLPL